MSKRTPVKEPKKQKAESKAEEPQPLPQEQQPAPETPPEPVESPLEPPIITLESLYQDIQSLKLTIAQIQETISRKRKPPVSNGKVRILDKHTGAIYPSKNNAYQTLLKDGDLKDLVEKGLFGDIPKKNTFGWYVLKREWPERFEELPVDKEQVPEAPELAPATA